VRSTASGSSRQLALSVLHHAVVAIAPSSLRFEIA